MKFRKVLKYFLIFLVISFIALLIGRYIYLEKQEDTALQVEKIHNTKLQLTGVMGKNLPPDPGETADDTVQGVDANGNGIRDDVELAIFREYPNSAKTRAVLLQYALALQMQVIQPFVNEQTVTEVIREQSRAYQCVGEILVRDDDNEVIMNKYFEDADNLRSFIKDLQVNTTIRKTQRENFIQKVASYGESENEVCDIDYLSLPN